MGTLDRMRFLLVVAVFFLAMPITGSGWAEGSNVLLDPHMVCKKSRRARGKLAEICRKESNMTKEIIKGINLGFRECEYQFRNRRWNCTVVRKSMRKILMKDTRETAYVNAITAAGITYSVTRACAMGQLVECSCDENHRRLHRTMQTATIENESAASGVGNNASSMTEVKAVDPKKPVKPGNKKMKNANKVVLPEGDWKWGGCGDNVNFGYKKSKHFLDARYRKRSDIKTLLKLHNNDAGRLAVKDHMRLECKCHGLCGSCTIKTCWMKMPSFREVGDRLKERFDGAAKVIARNDGVSFMPEGPTIKPLKHDLVYTEESPDFCRVNHKTGAMGTQGRECNATSQGVDGCDLLCCQRGYDSRMVKEKVNCHCVFQWCCEVICQTCIEKRDVNTCK